MTQMKYWVEEAALMNKERAAAIEKARQGRRR